MSDVCIGQRVVGEWTPEPWPLESVPPDAFSLCSGPDQHRWMDPADAARCCNGYERAFIRRRDAAGDLVFEFEWRAVPPDAPTEDAAAPAVAFPFPAVTWDAGLTPFWPESPHSAFIEAIKEYRSQGLTGNAPRAGLEAMRLIDRWGRRKFIRRSASFAELGVARSAIDLLPPSATQRMLCALVAALTHDTPSRVPSVWALLVGYAGVLERSDQWELAADVLGTAVEQVRSREEQLQAPEFYNKIGACLRKAGRFNASIAAHRAGCALALGVGLPELDLNNRLGLAAALLAAGDIPGSDRAFADVARDADVVGLPECRATALHERALAMYARRTSDGPETPQALVWYGQALRGYWEDARRHRVLDDMATAFIDLSYLNVAREIYDYVFQSAEDPDVHVAVGLKAIRLAVLCGEQADFERYAAALSEERDQMTPEQHADYNISLGLGYWRCGRIARARTAYARALSIAEDCQLYQELHDAEQSRAGLDAGAPPPAPLRSTDRPPPPAVARVIASIRAFVSAQLAPPR
jgi:tetratricopeptide (TPR) repeat protein